MAPEIAHSSSIWALAREQRWALASWQLVGFGLSEDAIRHRVAEGRLHPVHRGVYAVGRRELSREGVWIAALLACGWRRPGGPWPIALSHDSAAAHLGVRPCIPGPVHLSSQAAVVRRLPGIRVHRRVLASTDVITRYGIPTTSVVLTLIDLATTLSERRLEAAINEADRLGLVSPPSLLAALAHQPPRPGIGALRQTLTRHALELPTTLLEALFPPIAARAGLPSPRTQHELNGFKVDFYFPSLGLVVETDSLRHHRTPAQQAADQRRDQAHTAAGLTPLRFTHHQVKYEPRYVEAMLKRVARRLISAP
ncbi:MAG: DUF559 domain-containing protein [Solirubrobacterales bacterium]